MSEKSRTYNTLANSGWGIAASALTIILNFVVRVMLVRELGEEINGLNSLFQSILGIIALMELGIGSAMIIHLYEPVKNKDFDVIRGILRFYRQVYTWLSIAFFSVCIIVAFFFLDSIVTSSLKIETVRVYFLLFGFVISVNYLTYYKRSILFADQRSRVSMIINALCELFFRGLQIFFLVVVHEYLVFLILLLLEKLTANLICIGYVNKNYPELKNVEQSHLPKEKKIAIFNTVKPLMVNQMSSTAQNTSTSILISMLLGNVCIVGYYGNYALVISVVQLIYSQIGGAFTTSFGNLSVDGNKAHMKKVFTSSAFVMNWMACFFCSAFLVCIEDFIFLFFGPNFVLDQFTTLLLTLNMMCYLLNIPAVSVQNAMGLHKLDAVFMVIQATCIIIGGYIFGRIFGMHGILLSFIVPVLLFSVFNKGIIITKKAFNTSAVEYVKFIMREIFKVVLVIVMVLLLSKQITINNIYLRFFINIVMALIISFVIPLLLFFKTDDFKEVSGIVRRIIKK